MLISIAKSIIVTVIKVVGSQFGDYMNVQLGLGHNNDQGMLSLTGLNKHIEENDIYLLGDGGYSHHRIITPSDVPAELEQVQKDERSSVEALIGFNKGNGLARDVVRHPPELHQQSLMVTYELSQLKLKEAGLRSV